MKGPSSPAPVSLHDEALTKQKLSRGDQVWGRRPEAFLTVASQCILALNTEEEIIGQKLLFEEKWDCCVRRRPLSVLKRITLLFSALNLSSCFPTWLIFRHPPVLGYQGSRFQKEREYKLPCLSSAVWTLCVKTTKLSIGLSGVVILKAWILASNI